MPCTGKIGDFVWLDLDGDGIQDAGEPGINGVTVELYQGATLVASTTTANNGVNDGYYQFTGLCDGTYTVKVNGTTVPAGLTQTTTPGSSNGNDGVGDDSNNPGGTTVTLGQSEGRDIQTIDFGYEQNCTGQIGDFVWNDSNGNGCQDAGEPGISGVQVDLYSGCGAGATLIKSTTTDSNGKYLFSDLCAGTYTVRFYTPNGFVHTQAHQTCNFGGSPDENPTDSNCECTGADNCDVCVTLPAANSVNLTIDCGYVGSTPCVELTKTAASQTALAGSQMVYTYLIHNCGGTPWDNLAIIDDNGTPGDTSDDFTVASGISLAVGETKTFTATVTLAIPLCSGSGSPPASAGSLDVDVLASGDIKVTLRQSRSINDNVYGAPAVADGWSSHTFGNLTGSDKAEFRFTDSTGKVVLDFYLDYISQATSKTFPSGTVNYPSGYGTLGANGGDGSIIAGSVTNVLWVTTSLTDNLNSGLNGGFPSPYLVDSPTPEASFPNWNYVNSYTVIVSKNAFGAAGFGGVTIPYIHNSPAKTGDNQISPTPCADCINNIARVVTVVGGNIGATLATDNAEVCIDSPQPPATPCLITPGTLKIDKKTVQLPLKNNGTVDIFLSEVNVTWNQAVNGNLVKMSLNGDFWVGSASSGTVLNSGFNADANKRKIAKGQTKTLVLTFQNDASKTVGDYSGTISFGSDPSCVIAFPPATQPAAFSCDGHLEEIQMKWTGSGSVDVKAWYGGIGSGSATLGFPKTFANVAPGDVVVVNGYSSSPNDVVWEIFDHATGVKIGNSDFHLSCSDADMNGPEDCGKLEGDGKALSGTWVTTWQLVGMTTKNGTKLTCP